MQTSGCPCGGSALLAAARERIKRLEEANLVLTEALETTMDKYRALAMDYAAKESSKDYDMEEERMKEALKKASESVRSMTAELKEKEAQLADLSLKVEEKNQLSAKLLDDNETLTNVVEQLTQKLESFMVENTQLRRKQQLQSAYWRRGVEPGTVGTTPSYSTSSLEYVPQSPPPRLPQSVQAASPYQKSEAGSNGLDAYPYQLDTLSSLRPMMEMVQQLEKIGSSVLPSTAVRASWSGGVPVLRLICALHPSTTPTLALLRDCYLTGKEADDVLRNSEARAATVAELLSPDSEIATLRRIEEQSRLLNNYAMTLHQSPPRSNDSLAFNFAAIQHRLGKISEKNDSLRTRLLRMTADAEGRAEVAALGSKLSWNESLKAANDVETFQQLRARPQKLGQ